VDGSEPSAFNVAPLATMMLLLPVMLPVYGLL